MRRTSLSVYYKRELSKQYQITSQRELRKAFWRSHSTLHRQGNQTQNDYPTDVRVAWCDYVDAMARDGIISEALAQRATL